MPRWPDGLAHLGIDNERVTNMSVRMALAKLCACTCGGALVGGGAVHVAEQTQTRQVYQQKQAKRVVHRTKVAARPVSRVRRVVTRTRATCPPAVVTVTSQGAPIPLPPSFAGSSGEMPMVSGGGGGGAAARARPA